MNDLLDLVLDAHGGLTRWSGVSTLTAKLAAGGPFWGLRRFPDAFGDETLTIDTRRQSAAFTPWIAPGQTLRFDTAPERVWMPAWSSPGMRPTTTSTCTWPNPARRADAAVSPPWTPSSRCSPCGNRRAQAPGSR